MMPQSESCLNNLHDSLSRISVEHVLQVLAEANSATVILFDACGKVMAGPVPGSDFVRHILKTERGRSIVIAAHRSKIDDHIAAEKGPDESILTEGSLDHFAIPLIKNGKRIGMLTLGDRPRQSLSPSLVTRIAETTGLPAESLQPAAERLESWSTTQASAARNLAAVLAELLVELCTQDEHLRKRIDELTMVYNVSGLLAGSLDLQEVLNKTAKMVCMVMKVKACSIRMLDEATGELSIKAVHNLSEEYLSKGPVNISENPIDKMAIAGEMVRIVNAPTDPRTRYPQQAEKEGIVSGLVCGMAYRGKIVGVLRVYTDRSYVFSPFEESLLRAVASQAAAAIVNARLLAETIEQERYARQIAYAGEVQRRMIPASPPKMDHVEIGAVYRPTYQVGGDFYDFISLPKGNLGVGIADVSGKGVPASLQMASLRSALRVYAYFTYDIDRIMAEVNRHVCRETTLGEFATVLYGVLTPDGKRLTYSNAGHEPPILLRQGQIQHLDIGGMVLGVDKTATFDRALLHLQPGDVILLYTDGAVEALNFNDEQFGRNRLVDSLVRYADQPAQLIAKNILWDIRRFRGLADRTDDLTMVVLKIK